MSKILSYSNTLAAALAVLSALACSATPEAPGPAGPADPAGPHEAPDASLAAADDAPDPEGSYPATIVLATVNQVPLTLDDAMQTFLSSHTGHQMLVRGEPAVRELAGRLIEQQLFLAEAKTLGVTEDEAVAQAVDEYAHRQAEIVFWRKEVDEKVHVSDEDVEAFYDKTDVAVSISVIEAEGREQAEALRARVEQGEDFVALAEAESTHASAAFGGVMPYVRRGDLDPALEAEVFALEELGSLTPVVQTAGGFAFARLDERTVNEERPSRDVMLARIRGILEGRHEDELRAAAEERIRREAEASVDESLLTRAALLGDSAPEALVAESAGEQLTLGGLREMLDLDAVRTAPIEEVDEAIPAIVDDWVQKRAVRRAVERAGLLTEPDVVRRAGAFRKNAILRTLYQQYVYAEIEIAEDEIREYYEARKESEFTRPPEIRLGSIVTESIEEATELKARIEAGEDFPTLAREHSIDAMSAMHGGRIGWVRPGQIVPEVETVAFELEVGQMAGPIETDAGYSVIKVLERKEETLVPYRDARSAALQRMLTERQKAAYRQWVVALKERADVEIRAAGIEQAVAWLDEQAELAEAADEASPEGPPSPHAANAGGGHP